MSGHHDQPSEDRLYWFDQIEIDLDDFEATGYLLDIGGGGEGIIGRLKGEQVVAIDRRKDELLEAPAGPLKIVMDARDLQFLDDTFALATAFFTLMYIKGPDLEPVFREVYRVLAPGGRWLVWDVALPCCPEQARQADPAQDIVAFPLLVRLPGEEVRTGYGTRWPEQMQDAGYYVALARRVGFQVEAQRDLGRSFHLVLTKA